MPGNAWLKADLLPWWSYATLTQNFVMAARNTLGGNALAITWSLAIEEQFYPTLPLVVRFTSRKTLKRILLAIIVLAPAIRLLVFLRLGPTAAHVLMPCRADALLIGVGIAALKRENHSIPYMGPLIVSAVILAVCIFKSWGLGSFEMSVWGYSFVALFYGSLLCAVLDRRPRVLRWGWLSGLGIIAYATYLFHQTLQGLLYWKLFAINPILRVATVTAAVIALCLTLLLARISWKYFERPLISRGHRSGYSPKNNSLEST
jgi:peptidoglycan/LPS O-acetylase OafA/YrhL